LINFEKLIDDFLVTERDIQKTKRRPDHIDTFHCHYAGHCERQIWNAKKGKSEFPINAIGSMRVGTLIHKFMEEEVGKIIEGEKEVPAKKHDDGIFIEGRADLVDSTHVYDFKSEASLRWLPKKDGEQTFREFHEPQIQLYMWLFEKKFGSLVYIDKGNLRVKQFEIEYSPSTVRDVLFKYRKVFDKLDNEFNPFTPCDCFLCKQEDSL